MTDPIPPRPMIAVVMTETFSVTVVASAARTASQRVTEDGENGGQVL
jgi:hypothetical protein